ncbi:hypothetical protein OY671_002648 [Metschnikowia pulcherrima]|nr:hypothetical protein OY671_002648 [Metschnikowia pulcherrima]
MISESEIISRIEESGSYHFRDLLTLYTGQSASTEQDDKILNTIELFAFGGYSSYARTPEHYINLSEKGKLKLAELSIISVISANVGNAISMGDLLHAVSPFVKDASALETILITMIDSGAVSVKIDERENLLRVMGVTVLRDAYNEQTYQLRVLEETDLMVMSVGKARQVLQKWLTNSIIPARKECEV